MAAQQFDQEMLRLIRARPFHPFAIVMEAGRTLHVVMPKAAINNGGTGIVDSLGEIHLIECEQVRELKLASEELTT
jgi:hypothetical protein